ncbi:uncharacterized protein BDZ99DRAFT_468869 [Mytilinidion resinicola]|uniref:Putative gamma-glutamylcyclotransferase n=1 Tax=Mytilinidion resinicola TaxID=574789 RepID=A0A6A6Y2E8_9PEZI|nr:uncharacterized protein BDZ99DRAFT_468869 [Mytilinidion resinicola]KAF2802395.1 hypothetical protein BDZ99DRAFT_468869 [Mytilinidion resinicola]
MDWLSVLEDVALEAELEDMALEAGTQAHEEAFYTPAKLKDPQLLRDDTLQHIHDIQNGVNSRQKRSQIGASQCRKRETTGGNVFYLVKLEPPFSTPEELAVAANLGPNNTPSVEKATGDEGTARFCRLSPHSKDVLVDWLNLKHPSYRPTFIRIGKASKELSSTSTYPSLGVDTTLPQHRPNAWDASRPYPLQDEYPVWYFFYGTLADQDLLANLFGWSDVAHKLPILYRASLKGGILKTWGGRYRAMIDSPGNLVEGFAYQVQSRDEEDALLVYETEKYEVVRCNIVLEVIASVGLKQLVKGCTFRYAGSEEDLA